MLNIARTLHTLRVAGRHRLPFCHLSSSSKQGLACPPACRASSTESEGAQSTQFDPLRQTIPLEPGLYVVATPIGNLQDITIRALTVLRSVSVILAEDTRHTRVLLNHYGIKTATLSCHAHNEKQKASAVVERLKQGEAIALVSDAGTPAISDPGQALVVAAIAAGVRVLPVPGPCALIAALVASGLPTSAFAFHGFLPPKPGARRKQLGALRANPATLVFYVPPHGLADVLSDLAGTFGPDRRCVLAKELTKLHEAFHRCTLGEAVEWVEASAAQAAGGGGGPLLRGEFVVMVEGAGQAQAGVADEEAVKQALEELLEAGTSVSVSARQVSEMLGLPKSGVYATALALDKARRGRSGEGGGGSGR